MSSDAVVFLFTDIEGSSRLWEEHTGEMGAVIARHDDILRQAVGSAGGRITKHTGDGITAAFQGGEPVACALETLKRFAEEDWGPVGELRIRAGLHAGAAQFQESAGTPGGDYFGPQVNATARVMAAAWGGQILLTPEVIQVSSLPPQATLLDLGEHLLKNISAPQRLYQLDHPQLRWHEFPPPRTLSGQSIRLAVTERGEQMAGQDPGGMLMDLVAAVLAPGLQGELDAESGVLEGNLSVLEDLGAVSLRSLVASFAGRVRAGRPLPASELQARLQKELQSLWQAGGEDALAVRADASRLLRAVHGVEATMAAATGEVKEALARSLAELGGQFGEFRWMLAGVQETLAEVRTRQALQLALQREQLDLQRRQLVKTNLILQRQQVARVALAVPLGEVAEEAPADLVCPYKGLAAFEAEDAEYFFGREELGAELTARLAGTRFLAVVGASGSGKSSLARAGLLPAIWSGALPGSEDWHTLVLTPGAHPLEELAVRVSLLRGIEASGLHEALRTRPQALHLAVKQALVDEPEEVRLLLVVDQFEEVFALCRNVAERRAFVEALLYAVEAEEGRTVVVPTIRADFYGRCADYPALAAAMSDGLLVGPMSAAELREAITRPAEIVGLCLEPGLAETVISDVADEPGALPLLSHALLETFRRRRGRMLTLSGYAASGGVAGAIAQTADTVYDALNGEEQALAQGIFLRLTELGGEGTQDTRRRVALAELVQSEEERPKVEALLQRLADARLITTGEDRIEVAHEALIREWGRLQEWLDASRDDLRAHRRLTAAAAEWIDAMQDDGFLLQGSRLSQFESWAKEIGPTLTQTERDFLQASVALREQRQAERERERAARARAEAQARTSRRLRRLALGLAGVLIFAIAATVFALLQRNESQQSLRQSISHRLTAASIISFNTYPERSVLLALEAVSATYSADKTVTREANTALRRALESLRVQLTLFGHAGPVYGATFSPDGTCLASASADRTARVWDAASGQELFVLPGHRGLVRSVAFGTADGGAAPCGARVATADDNGTVMIWSLASSPGASSETLLTLTGHTGPVWSVVFNPGGARLATAGEDGTARVWDAATGQELVTFSGHTGPVYGVAFSANGSLLATASEDGTAEVWSLAAFTPSGDKELAASPTAMPLLTLSGHAGPVYAVAFSPECAPLTESSASGSAPLPGTAEGQQREGGGQVVCETRLATAGADGAVRVWDAASGEELISFAGHSTAVRGVAFSADGTRLATASEDETVRIWSLEPSAGAHGQESLTLFGHTGPVYGVAFSPDGTRLATASEDRTVKVWNVSASQESLAFSGHVGPVYGVAFSADGKRLATAGEDGTARVWDAASGQELLTLPAFSQGFSSVAIDPDGTRLATSGSDGTAKVWSLASAADTSSHELLSFSGHSGWIIGIIFSPDGSRLATAGMDGTARIWSSASGEEILTLSGDGGWVQNVAFSPEGTRLATALNDGTTKIWDAASGRELRTLSSHTGAALGLAFSPDGARLATSGLDGTGRVWDLASGREVLTLSGHTGWVVDLAFAPDGTRLATASADGTARVWDATSGEELLTVSGYADFVTRVAFSPDGKRLVVAGSGGMVRVVILDMEDLMAMACNRVTRNLTDAEWKTYLGRDVPYRRTCPDLPTPPDSLTYGHID